MHARLNHDLCLNAMGRPVGKELNWTIAIKCLIAFNHGFSPFYQFTRDTETFLSRPSKAVYSIFNAVARPAQKFGYAMQILNYSHY